jgi:hypothetical protein
MRDRNRRDAVTKGLRRLGVSLIEAIFYLTVTASVLTLTAQILDREATRETNEAFAADLRQMIAAARLYADGRAGQVHQLLMNNDPLITDIPIAQLVDEGLLPGLFGEAGGSGLAMHNDKEYRLWARGVLRSAAIANPNNPPTVTRGAVDTNGNGVIDAPFTDLNPANDELDIEMVLVTRDTALPATPVFNRADGNRIVAETGLPTAGFIQRDATGAPIATGAYGGWTLDLSPYSDSAVVASATDFALIDNNFAGLIAVPIHGVMSRAAGPNPSNVEDQFARCAALPDGHPLQDECYENPAVWTDMVFNQLFSDGSVRFPGIEGVYRITMTDPANFPAGNDIASIRGLTILEMSPPFSTGAISDTLDVFPQISNVSRLSMGRPGSDGIPAGVFGDIRNLHGLSCAAGGVTDMQNGRFVVDCDETVFSEFLSVTTPDPAADPERRLFNVTSDAVLRGAVALQSTAPLAVTLGGGGAPGTGVLTSGQISLFSDSAFVTLEPGTITASGRFQGQTVSTPALSLGAPDPTTAITDAVDVTTNLRRRPVSRVSAAEDVALAFPQPACGSGSTAFIDVVSVLPPGPETRSQDLIRDVAVSADASFNVSVTVTYADVTAGVKCDVTREVMTHRDTLLGPADFTLSFSEERRTVHRNFDCTYGELDTVNTDAVINPLGTRVTAIVGCE